MVRPGFRSTCVARTYERYNGTLIRCECSKCYAGKERWRKYLRNRESHSLAVRYQPVYSRTKALSRRILSYAKDVTRREAKWPKIQMMDDVRRGDLSWVPIPELEPDAVGLRSLEHAQFRRRGYSSMHQGPQVHREVFEIMRNCRLGRAKKLVKIM